MVESKIATFMSYVEARNANEPDPAKNGLIEQFALSEIQAKAILELRLQRLTGLERDKIIKEYEEIMALINDLRDKT